MADVFISYSRRDKAFVQTLHEALTESQYETWIDWQDIAPTAEWWREIEIGIEDAHTFIFVLSPDSVTSDYCRAEAEYAASHHKRIIPIIRRKFPKEEQIEDLAHLQWLSFLEEDPFEPAFNSLVDVINTDLEHKKIHTRLQIKALEWKEKELDNSLLLRGSELNGAEQWLLQASAGKEPKPTELQGEYIAVSRKGATGRQRTIIGTLSGLLLLALGASGFAIVQSNEATAQRDRAEKALIDVRTERDRAEKALEQEQTAREAAQAAQVGERTQRRLAEEKQQEAELAQQAETVQRQQAQAATKRAEAGETAARQQTILATRQRTRAESSEQTVQQQREVAEIRALSAEAINLLEVEPLRASLLAIQAGGQYIKNEHRLDPQGDTLNLVQSSLYEIASKSLETNVIINRSKQFSSIAFSPDGEKIASASWDGTVRIWDKSGNEINRIGDNEGNLRVSSVEFSPDGQFLVSGWEDGDFAVWNLATNRIQEFEATERIVSPQEPTRAPYTFGNKGSVLSLAISPDSKTVVSGNVEGRIRIWDLDKKTFKEISAENCPTNSFPDRSCRINAIDISPNGQTIATAHADGTVRKWSLQGRPIGNPLEGSSREVHAVFIDDSGTVISGDEGGTIRIWRGDSLSSAWNAHLYGVNSISLISSSGNTLDTIVSGGDDGFIRIWNLNGNVEHPFELPAHQDPVSDIDFSPDGKTFISSSEDGTIRFWDYSDTVFRRQIVGKHDQAVNSVAVSPDGRYIASGGRDNMIKLWSSNFAQSGSEPIRVFSLEGPVSSVAFNSESRLLAAGSWEATVKLWDIKGGNLLPNQGWAEDTVTSVAFSPNLEYQLLLIGGNSSSYLWNYNHPQAEITEQEASRIRGSVWSTPDGQDDKTWQSYVPLVHEALTQSLDAFGGRNVFPIPNEIQSVAFSQDGETIISADSNGMVQQWGGIGYSVGEPFKAHNKAISSVAISPTDDIYATASEDWTIRLWRKQYDDPDTKQLWTSSFIERTVQSFAFLTDRRILMNPLRALETELKESISQLVSPPFRGHRGVVWSVAFSSDGQMLASGGQDGTVRLWDLQGNPVGRPLEGHRGPVYSVSFTPDDQYIVSGGADGTVRLWRPDTWQDQTAQRLLVDWMSIACNRLQNHFAFHNSEAYADRFNIDISEIQSAKAACEHSI